MAICRSVPVIAPTIDCGEVQAWYCIEHWENTGPTCYQRNGFLWKLCRWQTPAEVAAMYPWCSPEGPPYTWEAILDGPWCTGCDGVVCTD